MIYDLRRNYKSKPRSKSKIPPTMVDAPRTEGTPATGTLGVGVAVMPVGIGVGVTVGIWVGVAVMTMATGLDVGTGVAVSAGQTQVNKSGHSGLRQRLMPCTVAHTKPDEHPLSSLHDASQVPGTNGPEVGVGVEVGVSVGVEVGIEVGVAVGVAVAVGIGVAVATTAAGGATATVAGLATAGALYWSPKFFTPARPYVPLSVGLPPPV